MSGITLSRVVERTILVKEGEGEVTGREQE